MKMGDFLAGMIVASILIAGTVMCLLGYQKLSADPFAPKSEAAEQKVAPVSETQDTADPVIDDIGGDAPDTTAAPQAVAGTSPQQSGDESWEQTDVHFEYYEDSIGDIG